MWEGTIVVSSRLHCMKFGECICQNDNLTLSQKCDLDTTQLETDGLKIFS